MNFTTYLYNPLNHTKAPLLVGKAPEFMVEGKKYYSDDGIKYTDINGNLVGEEAIHFNLINLLSTTQYSAEQLDQYLYRQLSTNFADKLAQLLIDEKGFSSEEATEIAAISPLAGLGVTFKEMEANYGVNALYLMAHAIHESAWGTSRIAQLKIIFMALMRRILIQKRMQTHMHPLKILSREQRNLLQ